MLLERWKRICETLSSYEEQLEELDLKNNIVKANYCMDVLNDGINIAEEHTSKLYGQVEELSRKTSRIDKWAEGKKD